MGRIVNIIEEKEHISFEVRYPKRKDYLYNDWLNKEVEIVEVGESGNIKNTVVGVVESKHKYIHFNKKDIKKGEIISVALTSIEKYYLSLFVKELGCEEEKFTTEEERNKRYEEVMRELEC